MGGPNWDESKHPRAPAGSPQGGEFTAGGGPDWGEGYSISSNVNKSLREGKKLTDVEKRIVKRMDDKLEKASLPESLIVYRGVEKDLWRGMNGKTWTDKGFMSGTTRGEDFAKKFGKVVVSVFLPKGAHAAKNVGSFFGDEGEVIVARSSKFLVTRWPGHISLSYKG